MRRYLSPILFAGLLLLASSSTAMEIANTCRYFGNDFKIGDSICLQTPLGLKQASCVMELNNPSWKISHNACPTRTAILPRKSSKALDYLQEYIKGNVK